MIIFTCLNSYINIKFKFYHIKYLKIIRAQNWSNVDSNRFKDIQIIGGLGFINNSVIIFEFLSKK